MSDDISCPIDGCDFRGNIDSLLHHTNPKNDHPQWSELKDRLDTDGNRPEAGDGDRSDCDRSTETTDRNRPKEAEKSPATDRSGSVESDGDQKAAEETDKATDTTENDPPEEADSVSATGRSTDSMPSHDELKRQKAIATDQDTDENDDPEATDSSGLTSSGGGIPVPVSTTTITIGLALFVMIVLLMSYTRSTDESESEISDTEATNEGTDDLSGGLKDDATLEDLIDE